MTDIRSLRTLAALAAVLLLGGCNLVVSETPVFTAADAAGAPPLKPGIWAAPQPNCDFKPADPLAQWPKCAGGAAITPTAILAAVDPSSLMAPDQPPPASAKPPLKVPYVLAAGDPRVMQIHFVLPIDPAIKAAFFYFIALRPIAHDADGRIIDAEVWLVQCGPPPPPSGKGAAADQGAITDHPLPGMTVTKGECNPTGKAAVLNAAQPSHAWAGDQVGTLHWVRDGLK